MSYSSLSEMFTDIANNLRSASGLPNSIKISAEAFAEFITDNSPAIKGISDFIHSAFVTTSDELALSTTEAKPVIAIAYAIGLNGDLRVTMTVCTRGQRISTFTIGSNELITTTFDVNIDESMYPYEYVYTISNPNEYDVTALMIILD